MTQQHYPVDLNQPDMSDDFDYEDNGDELNVTFDKVVDDYHQTNNSLHATEVASIVIDSAIEENKLLSIESIILLDALRYQQVQSAGDHHSSDFKRVNPLGLESCSNPKMELIKLRQVYATEKNFLKNLGKKIYGNIVKVLTDIFNWIRKTIDRNGSRLSSIDKKFKTITKDRYNDKATFTSSIITHGLTMDMNKTLYDIISFTLVTKNASNTLKNVGRIVYDGINVTDSLVNNIYDHARGKNGAASTSEHRDFQNKLGGLKRSKGKLNNLVMGVLRKGGSKIFCGIELSGYDASNLKTSAIDKGEKASNVEHEVIPWDAIKDTIKDSILINDNCKKALSEIGNINKKIITIEETVDKNDDGSSPPAMLSSVKGYMVDNLKTHKNLIRATINGNKVIIAYLNQSYKHGSVTK